MSIIILYSIQTLMYSALVGSLILLYDMVIIGLQFSTVESILVTQYLSACLGFFIAWLLVILFYLLGQSLAVVSEREYTVGKALMERDRP